MHTTTTYKLALSTLLTASFINLQAQDLQTQDSQPQDSQRNEPSQDTKLPNEVYRLQTAKVSASKSALTLEEAPGNATIITDKQIHLRPNSKISDTLRGVEGIRQSKSRGLDTFDSITIRGIQNGAMIMIDGVILNDLNNNTKLITALNPSDLAQVEVIRGPFSNLYGSGALSGAINFVTSMPQDFEIKASLGYGNPFLKDTAQQNLVRGFFSIGDALLDKKLKLKLSYAFSTSQGYPADSAFVYPNDSILANTTGALDSQTKDGVPIKIVGDMGKQAYQTHDIKLKGQYDFENAKLEVGEYFNLYAYDHTNQKSYLKDSQGNPFYGDNSNTSTNANRPLPIYFGINIGKEKSYTNLAYIGYQHYFSAMELHIKYSRIDTWRWFNNPDGGANALHANTTINGGAGSQQQDKFTQNNLDIFASVPFEFANTKSQEILFGAQIRQLGISSSTHTITNWKDFSSTQSGFKSSQGGKSLIAGAFLQWQSQWLESLYTSIGGRYDYWLGYDYHTSSADIVKNNAKSQFSPKATINYLPTNTTTLKASVGQAFRTPTISQLFQSPRTYTDGTKIAGNPNLAPENATSFDIGLEQKIPAVYRGIFKVYYFHTNLSNVIYTPANGGMPLNGGRALIKGIETSYKQELPLHFGVLVTYTYTHSKMLKNPSDTSIEGKRLAGIPEHLAFGQIYYDDGRFFGSFGVEYMSKPFSRADNADTISKVYGTTDSYVLADVRLGAHFAKHYEVSLDFSNIFNHKYYSYYLAPGASFYLQLAAKF